MSDRERVSDERLRNITAGGWCDTPTKRLVSDLAVDLVAARDRIARAAVWLQEDPQTFAEGLTKVIAARAILTGES